MTLVVVGSVALDTIETPSGKVHEVLGGSATYFSLAARIFLPPYVVAVIGDDFPEEHLQLLLNKDINLDGLTREKGKTFRWEGFYPPSYGDPTTLRTELNVFADFKPLLPSQYRDSKFVFLANIDPDLQMEVIKQIKAPQIIAADTMNYWIESKHKELLTLFKNIDILIINEQEANMLTGETNLRKAALEIIKMGPTYIIIKRGEYGVMLFSRETMFITPAYFLEQVVDPTGAGDSFAGAFMGYLTQKGRIDEVVLRQAVIYGVIISSFTVEGFSVEKLVNLDQRRVRERLRFFDQYTKCTF
ncbi:bifunctional hydroxymethylpyrimidine kinase/phosphomethylpyrimidine kinase [bacterium]|nr:bifunctional hydroxymethylpyrimidine kinase/phosphomethylpyrimidine kinase [bacterium]